MLKGRLFFDITKASKQRHKSGLLRVSDCVRRELKLLLGERLVDVRWSERKSSYVLAKGKGALEISREDVLLTGELFCEYERPGIEAFLESRACASYCIFHDAIPLQFPEFTWPHSVQRHPVYMKMLSKFSGAFAVSQHSAILLERYWEWLEYQYAPSVRSIQLGADGVFEERSESTAKGNDRLQLLMLGIIEERKGHDYALEAFKALWDEGREFDVCIVGRANPHFGKKIAKSLKAAMKQGYPLRMSGQVDDDELRNVFVNTDLMVFASKAEGCGLPVLESIWKGVPVLSSDLKSVGENARFGGCRLFDAGSVESLKIALESFLDNRALLVEMYEEIETAALPRWRDTAQEILKHLISDGC